MFQRHTLEFLTHITAYVIHINFGKSMDKHGVDKIFAGLVKLR